MNLRARLKKTEIEIQRINDARGNAFIERMDRAMRHNPEERQLWHAYMRLIDTYEAEPPVVWQLPPEEHAYALRNLDRKDYEAFRRDLWRMRQVRADPEHAGLFARIDEMEEREWKATCDEVAAMPVTSLPGWKRGS